MSDAWIPGAIERRDARRWEEENMPENKPDPLDAANDYIEKIEERARQIKWRAEALMTGVMGTDFDHPLYPHISWLHGIAEAMTAILSDAGAAETEEKIARLEATQREIEE